MGSERFSQLHEKLGSVKHNYYNSQFSKSNEHPKHLSEQYVAAASCRRKLQRRPLLPKPLQLALNFPTLHALCSASTFSMSSATAFEAEAATLELKNKPYLTKPLHAYVVVSSLDSRSIFYLALLAWFYCCVLIRASAAANLSILENKTSDFGERFSLQEGESVTVENGASLTTATLNNSVLSSQSNAEYLPAAPLNSSALLSEADLPDNAEARNAKPKEDLHRLFKRDATNMPDDEDDSSYHDDEFDEYDALIHNKSAKGKYIGAPCTDDMKCEATLLHVTCDRDTQTCGCEKNYPVQLGLTKGCDKPKKLGEQCFYDETCMYNDENSLCVQVRHNAKCECASGFHSVSYTKPTRRVFCTQDLSELSSDLPTLLGVSTGIAVLAGLICMVLHLFSKTKYPRHRNFGDANLPPPILYSSDTGIPLTVQSGRPSSRSSLHSSGSIGSYGNRRSSTGGVGAGNCAAASGSKGILVSTSRTGSRRPSLASVHSTSSSVRSYSMMRFEKEAQQKEIRHEMKLRLARLQQQQHLNQNKPQIIIGDVLHHGAISRISMPTPSPLTPNSTDELLPVDESQEYACALKLTEAVDGRSIDRVVAAATLATITGAVATTEAPAATTSLSTEMAAAAAYIGPCSSSTEAL